MNHFPSFGKGVKIHLLRQSGDSSNGQGVGVTLKTGKVSWKKSEIMDRSFDEEAIFPPGRIYFRALVGRSLMGSAKLFEGTFKGLAPFYGKFSTTALCKPLSSVGKIK